MSVSSLKIRLLRFGFALLAVGGLYYSSQYGITPQGKLEVLISRHLDANSTRSDIVTFIESQKLKYLYDRFQNRFVVYTNEDYPPMFGFGVTVTYIYHDENGNFNRAKVFTFYTFI